MVNKIVKNKKVIKELSKSKKGIYIKNFEGCDILNNVERGSEIHSKVGVIAYSKELRKLLNQQQFEVYKEGNKFTSDDVINVSFSYKQLNANDMVKKIEKKIRKNNMTEEIEEYYKQKIKDIKEADEIKKYVGRTIDEVRDYLYENGFTLKVSEEVIDQETGEVIEAKYIDYVMFKRSGSKARTGDVLFIKKELYEEMIKWSRMYIDFPTNEILDVVGLSAYQSLVSSAIEDIVHIKSKNIFIIDDVDSVFIRKAKKVDKDKGGNLVVNEGEFEITNSLFDGQSLLDSKYFKEGQSMMLLRNHFFKSASFNTNIQKYLKDNGFDENDTLKDMFGNEVKVKNIHLIITPNSLKALKFSKYVGDGSKNGMYNYWKELVDKEGCEFGVCKHEKASKYGDLQRMSYQMLNSLIATKKDIKELATFEIEYINNIKNNDSMFREFLIKNADTTNCNEMVATLMLDVPSFKETEIYKDFKSDTISAYVRKVRGGKLRVSGDNVVLLGNPMLMLKHTIGQLKVENGILDSEVIDETLKSHEDYVSCYNKIFNFNEELVGFRNPHTSPSNIARFNNTYNSNKENDIDRYFNLSKNIVAINSVKVEIADILSGSDFDSDFILLSNNKKLVEIANKCFRKELVCLNAIKSKANEYMLTLKDMSKMDNTLAKSKNEIGEVVNKGQLAMSTYYNELANENDNNKIKLKTYKEIVDIMTVLSGCAIDNAKRTYDVDISKVLENYKFDDKPRFWEFVSENNNKSLIAKLKKRLDNCKDKKSIFAKINKLKNLKFNCPMDYLQEVLDEGIKRAEETSSREKSKESNEIDRDFMKLLVNKDKNKGNRGQEKDVMKLIVNFDSQLKGMKASTTDKDKSREQGEMLADSFEEIVEMLSKKKMTADTMYNLLCKSAGQQKGNGICVKKYTLKVLNFLYKSQPELFSKAFKVSKKEVA